MTPMRMLFLACTGLLFSIAALPAQDGRIERIGIFIGANDGGKARVKLQWALSDARKMAAVMQELGGLSRTDTLFLNQPRVADIIGSLRTYGSLVNQKKGSMRRTEFVFYYSGHSDDKGLLVGEEVLPYGELRRALDDLKADVTIAILDSCASGAFTRQKGGIRIQPFLVDQTSDMRGYAYLTSSSEDEASQESDALAASFFTHYMVSGLRGAADASGDGRVTLNEAYHYAFNETLQRTEDSKAGPQHASYDIQLKGSGDLILSDLAMPNAGVVLADSLSGRYFLRDGRNQLVAEVGKEAGKPLSIAVTPGTYQVRQEKNGTVLETSVTVHPDSQAMVNASMFTTRASLAYRTRGGTTETETDPEERALRNTILGLLEQAEAAAGLAEGTMTGLLTGIDSPAVSSTGLEAREIQGIPETADPELSPLPAQGATKDDTPLQMKALNVSLVPGIGTVPPDIAYESLLTLSPTVAISHRSSGVAATGVGLINSGSMKGIAASGVFNLVGKDSEGASFSGVFNIHGGTFVGLQNAGVFNISAPGFQGVQMAGLFNLARGSVDGLQLAPVNLAGGRVRGVQIGIFNYADSMEGLPIGVFSWVRDGIHEVRATWDGASNAMALDFANGTASTYTRMGLVFDFDRPPLGEGGSSRLESMDLVAMIGGRIGDQGFHLDLEGGARFLDIADQYDQADADVVPTLAASLGIGLGDTFGFWFGPRWDYVDPVLASWADYEARYASVPASSTINWSQDRSGRIYSTFNLGISINF